MFLANHLSHRILKLLTIAFFVITLVFYPALLSSNLPFLSSSAVGTSINSQTTALQSATPKSEVKIAQAPAAHARLSPQSQKSQTAPRACQQ